MKNAVIFVIATALLTSPLHAAGWDEVRPGTFVGARLTIGGKTGGRPSAALTVAPTQSRTSNEGARSLAIGEGVALSFGAGRKPALTLSGIRADQALGLSPASAAPSGTKLGMSDEGKVAIGVGVALLLVAGGTYLVLANRCTECDQ